MGVFELAEAGFGVGLGAVGGDDLGGGPVVAVGEQDPLAEDLVFQAPGGRRGRCARSAEAGRVLPARVDVRTRLSQRGRQDRAISASTSSRARRVPAAGQAGLQFGELALGLGQDLVEAAGLPGVEGR